MTKQNLYLTIVYWAIFIVWGFLIWIQHDESSDETVKWFFILWGSLYIIAVAIVAIKKAKNR